MASTSFDQEKFDKIKNIPEMGDAILVATNRPDIISDSIEWFSNGHYSHVAMYVGGGDNSIIEYTLKGCIKDSLIKYCTKDMRIMIRRVKNLTLDQASKVKALAYKDYLENKPYGFLSYVGYIISSLLRKIGINIMKNDNPFRTHTSEVCSSGYVKWYKLAGIELLPKIGIDMVTPKHIEDCAKMQTLIYVDGE